MTEILYGNSKENLRKALSAQQNCRVAVITDTNTVNHCLPLVEDALPDNYLRVTFSHGEENKNLSSCEEVWDTLTEAKMDRNALVINLGGGVVTDLGGFCAATYKRGVRFINIPTTLLSQVDASVGGKLGVDFHGYKNHIGLFAEPEMVLIDPSFLITLPERELRSGFAEVIKHCLIADETQWKHLILNHYDKQDWSSIIPHSIGIKSDIVTKDFREGGLRKTLNFGHTIGHALESYYLNIPGKKLLHGEAIAIGVICEAWLSVEYNQMEKNQLIELQDYILDNFGKVKLDMNALDEVMDLMFQDKKNKGNTILFTLLNSIGSACWDVDLPQDAPVKAIGYYDNL